MERIYSDIDPYGEENWNENSNKSKWDKFKPMGDCVCGEYDNAYLNVGRTHWGYCPKCKTRWVIGENIFSSWHYEDQRDWDQNVHELKKFRLINDPHDRL